MAKKLIRIDSHSARTSTSARRREEKKNGRQHERFGRAAGVNETTSGGVDG
jgi:hypothetical protein